MKIIIEIKTIMSFGKPDLLKIESTVRNNTEKVNCALCQNKSKLPKHVDNSFYIKTKLL